jgi:hypothetical protein
MSTNGTPGAGGNYVGSDHCVLCHEVQTAQFLKTVHARLKAERYRLNHGACVWLAMWILSQRGCVLGI